MRHSMTAEGEKKKNKKRLPVFIMSYGLAGLSVSELSLIAAICSQCRQRTGLRDKRMGHPLNQC